MEDQVMDEGVETSVSDDVESEMDAVASKSKGSGYVEQDNL